MTDPIVLPEISVTPDDAEAYGRALRQAVIDVLKAEGHRIVKFADWVTEEDLMDLLAEEL